MPDMFKVQGACSANVACGSRRAQRDVKRLLAVEAKQLMQSLHSLHIGPFVLSQLLSHLLRDLALRSLMTHKLCRSLANLGFPENSVSSEQMDAGSHEHDFLLEVIHDILVQFIIEESDGCSLLARTTSSTFREYISYLSGQESKRHTDTMHIRLDILGHLIIDDQRDV